MNLRVLMRWNVLIMNWCGVIWRRAYHSCRVTSSWVNKGCRHCLGRASCCGTTNRRDLFLLPPLSSSIREPYLQTGKWKSGSGGQFCLMAILFWYKVRWMHAKVKKVLKKFHSNINNIIYYIKLHGKGLKKGKAWKFYFEIHNWT